MQARRTGEVVVFVLELALAGRLLGWSVCFGLRASMREKGLAEAGGAQGRNSAAVKLLCWELEKHLRR